MSSLRLFLERRFAASGGAMPFEDYMAAALYDPGYGYYTAGITEVGGERGDFATAASLSEGLARAVAGWVLEESEHFRGKTPVPLIEVGGGNGALAAAVRKSLGWSGRRRVRHHLVEISPVLRALQQRRLGRAVTWHGTLAAALAATGGRALIYSNELVDAFPVKWLRYDLPAKGWREVWVRYDAAAGLREEFRAPAEELSPRHFSALALGAPGDGQRVEIHSSYRRWIGEQLAPNWREGALLTIDYGGATAEAIYAPRPGGTMRAYCRHQRLEGGAIYARFGKQDLTSDVNFGDLVSWGEERGWETVRLESQADFLGRHGVPGDAMAGEGVGEAFLVLAQRNPGFPA